MFVRLYFNSSETAERANMEVGDAMRWHGVVVGASASQFVDHGSFPFVESYQKTLKNGIHSFPA